MKKAAPQGRPGPRASKGRPSTKSPQGPRRPDRAQALPGERLQKILAAAGAGSRRRCEELIRAGRVEVDGRVVSQLGCRVDPANQEVRLDGVALRSPRRVYLAVHKPDGVISTNRDPSGRPRVIDLLPNKDVRLFPVGRLDLHSEGLILLTNDGALANRLTHPRYGVEKTYRVLVAGNPAREALAELRRGIHLAEGTVRVSVIRVRGKYKKSTALEMVLREGRNREIRRAMAKLGHKVLRLIRIAVGPVRLGTLEPGAYRRLSSAEITALRRAAECVAVNKPKDEGQVAAPRAGQAKKADAAGERKRATRPGTALGRGSGKVTKKGQGKTTRK
ncbi:MAG: rRNA pseudouridine synthase [Pirellulales bacterium]|nr:rRNA pseudouridine synthase [Pirellulales bacterium]